MASQRHNDPWEKSQVPKAIALIASGYVIYKLWSKICEINPSVRIQSITVYPVKSCRGFQVDSWPISKYGLQHDREWMIYSPKTMRFICQRQVPAICLVTATLNGDSICLSAPGMDKISIPFTEMSDDNRLENVVLWKDKVNGVDQGDVAAEWLTRYVNKGREYRLMRISGDQGVYSRPTAPKYTPSELRGKSHASYADGFPYLVASTASLDEVNRRLSARNIESVPMNRFRPNIVINSSDDEPFIEDRIDSLSILQKTEDGKKEKVITLYLTKPCARCQIPTIDQDTAVIDGQQEPAKTMKMFRSGKHLEFERDKWENYYFGMNAVHDNFEGNVILSKDDTLEACFK